MGVLQAYLDDYGLVTATVSRSYNGGVMNNYYLLDERGKAMECLIAGVEQHDSETHYQLTIPADFEFGHSYTLWGDHGVHTPLQMRFITQTKEFDRQFDYDGPLGPQYSPEHTQFVLWAPTAVEAAVHVRSASGDLKVYPMKRGIQGVWRANAEGDLSHSTYVYVLERDGTVVSTVDPYALSSTANGKRSAVIDPRVLEQVKDPYLLPRLESMVDAIVYECNIRDMTSSLETGTSVHGTYMALTEDGTTWKGIPTGFSHIKNLGVTHVQVQPVSDFATVDELHPDRSYNWGYDPDNLLTLEGSYSSQPEDPYARMIEFRKMVTAFHARGIKVNVDVVLNHLYDAYASALQKTCPYYFFRYSDNRWLSNGSGCGNDLESRRPMMRNYLTYILTTWMKLYHVDGYRFDLMGILDVETMNMLAKACRAIKPDAMIYGEGWDLPTALPQQDKAKIYNQRQMPTIGHFNDTFRDVSRGSAADDRKYERGFLTGNTAQGFDMCSVLAAHTQPAPYFQRFDNPDQSINAMETHDNATIWDKMHFCCRDEPREQRIRRMKMMMAVTCAAQGVPFIHAGFEFADTKMDNTNSYNAGDKVNQMNWDRAFYDRELIAYMRKCITLRKSYKGFRLRTAEEIAKHVQFRNPDGAVVFYQIDVPDEEIGAAEVLVIVNGDWNAHSYHLDAPMAFLLDENGESGENLYNDVTVPMCSVLVLKKPLERKDEETAV